MTISAYMGPGITSAGNRERPAHHHKLSGRKLWGSCGEEPRGKANVSPLRIGFKFMQATGGTLLLCPLR